MEPTNHNYRQFLINNADSIMKINAKNQEYQTTLSNNNIYIENKPYIEIPSDLKQSRINKTNLMKTLNTPLL